MNYQILQWDSQFLGYPVARIESPEISLPELDKALSELNKKGVKLVYWPSKYEHDQAMIVSRKGFLADVKLVYSTSLSEDQDFANTDIVEECDAITADRWISELAIQSGEFSRFARDPKFPREKFISMYQTWIERSLKREIAKQVLVIRDDKTVGFITLGEKGNIGLLAVSGEYQERGYGQSLVKAAQKCIIAMGYETAQVVTQQENIPACRLYEKCGYSVENREYYYHFWL